ncbi:MAG: SDR family NAD(P)-dependent oxidoreductase, partial [Spirochaetota bacterium]|nr:SDR family NAD(P)-dependent oxidoreductase [Spirochaetota bacterium]
NKLTTGGDIKYYPSDISRLEDVEKLYDFVIKEMGALDILVNNAGILGEKESIQNYDPQVWREVLDCNLTGLFYVTKLMLPLILDSKSGRIINVSSSVGRVGRKGWGAYSVSKFGVEGLTQILSQELEYSQATVNSVNPGATRTDMRAKAYPEEDALSLPHPDEITELFVYLASEESTGISGQSFDVSSWGSRGN